MAELRFIQDFPAKGVKFIDISPKLSVKDDFKAIIKEMTSKVPTNTDYIIAPESRGYIFGTAMAIALDVGFVPIRKPGKLPEDLVITAEYEKEYGKDTLCLPTNENYKGKNFYFVDDVLATGGTLNAAKELVEKAGGNFAGAGVYINIKALNNLDVNSVENL
jgi:adenine phosphoribosyltransferase